MGYEILLCKVESVDTQNKRVLLKPQTPTHFNTIDVDAGDGLKFASSYAPYTRIAEPDKGKVFNTPVGFVNYPQQDDLVLVAVWVTDVSRQDRLRPKFVQNMNMEVIIFAKVSWEFPGIGSYDNVLADRSGAKIHFNHGWLDSEHLGKDVYSDQNIHLPTGHITEVGNRIVRISGKKFLPFGIHSHNLGKGGVSRDNSKILDESGEPINWGQAFTQDPTDASLYNDLLSLSKRGSKKFLEPPCPDPSTLMDIHESGYKHLVEQSGHVRTYMPTGGVIVIGDNGNDDNKKMAFDPEGQDEGSKYSEQSVGGLELHFVNGSNDIKMVIDAESDLITINMAGGGEAAGMEVKVDGANDEFVITTKSGKTFKVDGDDSKLTFDSDIEITGKLTVTSDIESTGGMVKAATKVVTPAVGDS